jgi:hypothetical protein
MSLSKITATSPSLPQHTLYADYARVLPISNLEPVFNEISNGKKRQKYNVTKEARLQDQVDFLSTIFVGSPITVDGEEYVALISGGRIPRRLSVVYLYVKHGIAPDDWVKAFQDSGLLSETKVEVAKYSTH